MGVEIFDYMNKNISDGIIYDPYNINDVIDDEQVKNIAAGKTEDGKFIAVLNKNSFYSESGGQISDTGVVIKTTNGGINWMNVVNPSPQLNPNLWSVAPVDSNIVYITSGKDLIIKTTNGGFNWDILNFCPDCNSAMTGVYFLNKDTGWFLGTNKVFRTYNGGNTLDSFYAPWFTNSDIYFKNIDTGIFCGTGRVFKSTDGGENWFDTNVPVNGVFYFFDKFAVYENNVWLTTDHLIFRSTDFCESWQRIEFSDFPGGRAIFFINEEVGFIGSGLNKVFKTINSGYNWTQQISDPSVLAFISSMTFVNDTVGWYVGGVGKIFHTTNGGELITSIIKTSELLPREFKLYQNFPNPFNNETRMEIDINNFANYQFKIIDLLGQEIEVIFDKYLEIGKYTVSYNPKNLSSGVYIYQLSSKKNTDNKKFILIK
jgi:photosystem II stability/assembly factor-like uncharacterized protein